MASPPILIDNYAQLQALMAQYMKRQDLNNLIPTFIALAEEWFDDMVLTRARRDSYIFTANQNVVQMPSDFKRVRNAWYNSEPLSFYPFEYRGAYAKGNPNVLPMTYQLNGDQFVLNVASLGGVCQIDYYVTLEPLSDSNVSNWLLEDSPTTYLFGSLVQAGIYMRDDARTAQWADLRDQAIASSMMDDERAKTPEEPLQIRAG